jgi:hypothetical protein
MDPSEDFADTFVFMVDQEQDIYPSTITAYNPDHWTPSPERIDLVKAAIIRTW